MMKTELSERKLQEKICDHLQTFYPNVYFCSDSSGIYAGWKTASLLKNTRSSHAQLDLIILEPNKEYKALILECKKETPFLKNGRLKTNKHLEDQLLTMILLKSKGYKCNWIWSLDQAVEILKSYLGEPIIDNEPLF